MQQLRTEDQDHVAAPIEGRIPSPHNHTPAPITLDASPSTLPPMPIPSADLKIHEGNANLLQRLNARVLVLSGYICEPSLFLPHLRGPCSLAQSSPRSRH